ncbi:unnamed protein product [Blepharisma stoltei]|uniref:Uncharacterized protein n=1 Tax=Blepharisma stoltei TaxID=1481888 RepID=A0AAU9JUK8_9CILI|nr:unnamed protein product [Blepharisma stoltei]
MDVYFTKGSPKVHDYNPITHSPFYSTPEPSLTYSRGPTYSKPFTNGNIFDIKSHKDPITGRMYRYDDGRKTLSKTGSLRVNRSFDVEKAAVLINPPRLYKSKPKALSPSPISGITRGFERSLSPVREELPTSPEPRFDFFRKTNEYGSIAGSLRKPVQVAYVNPYLLKATGTIGNQGSSNQEFKQAANAFFS